MLKQNLNHTSHFTHHTSNKGITLIALIITIIVMLILVAVTISMAINGGLFEKAGEAVGETENAVNKEQGLANGGITIDGKYYNSIDEYLNGGTTGSHNWTRTGDTFTCSHCNKTYEMGQVVNYTPAGKTSTTVSAQMSGLDKFYAEEGEYPSVANVDENGTQTIRTYDTEWIVLGIEDTNKDGINETLLITTAYPVKATTDDSLGRANNKTLILLATPVPSIPSGSLVFYGAAAYNNGPSEINRICEELYSNSEYGKARGMTIEDVNRALNYTPHGGMYYDGSNFYTTRNLTTKLKDVPVFSSLKANGTYTPDGTDTAEALGNYELNGYFYGLNNDGTVLVNEVDDTTSAVTTVEKNTIFGASKDYKYWLASRGVSADSVYAAFGPGRVYDGGAGSCGILFYSDGDEDGGGAGLRPVVSLRSKLPEIRTVIRFTLFHETYEALEGMTWMEWLDSSFCPQGFDISDLPEAIEIAEGRLNDVSPDDVILQGGSYCNLPR